MDYKKYSLENLENWLHDAMSCSEATPKEIYDVIVGVVKDNYYIYKHQTSNAYELLALLNGNGRGHNEDYDRYLNKKLSCDKDDPSPECKRAWNDFWGVDNQCLPEEPKVEDIMPPWGHSDIEALRYTEEELNAMCEKAASDEQKKDKVIKWQLPIQVDGLTGDCFVEFPDDLLDRAGLREGDTVEWIDRKDGSFELKKVTKPLGMDEC